MDYIHAIILGLVEGLTEFLPVSSTAHLRLTQHYLGISLSDEYWKLFAVFIQLGAILSVAVYFRQKLLRYCQEYLPLLLAREYRKAALHPLSLVLLSFFVTAIPAFFLSKLIGENLEKISVMAWSLALGGLFMLLIDLFFQKRSKTHRLEQITPPQAFFIGAVQILSAVFPGTSRSMSTIAGAQVVGLSRACALEFSFLVSLPIMAAATLYDLVKYIRGDFPSLSLHQIGVLSTGLGVSFLVALAVIAWFLNYVKKYGFWPFALYRVALALFLYYSL